MTEAEWMTAANPRPMIEFLERQPLIEPIEPASSRKLRLFACACCRNIWAVFGDERSRDAIEVAERFADCWATRREQQIAFDDAHAAQWEEETGYSYRGAAAAVGAVADPKIYLRAAETASAALNAAVVDGQDRDAETKLQVRLVHDIFGNPFRPVAFDSAWRTSTAVAVAEGIYAEKAFDRLPILADALQDAGCEDAAILGHLRGDGPHVRGCWALDLVLGKE